MPKIKSAKIHLKLSKTEQELRTDLLEFFYTHPEWPGAEAEDGGQTNLLAQCDICSSTQAGLVNKLNVQDDPSAYLKTLGDAERNTILGGRKSEISSSGVKVTPPEGLAIQKEGIAVGCHSCGTRIPSHTYHADHLPPAELLTNYMPRVCEKLLMLDLVGHFLEAPRLRPQCKRCSGKQGGDLKALAKRAQDYAKHIGVTLYK